MDKNPQSTPIVARLVAFFKSERFIGTVISVAVMALISWLFFYPDAQQGHVLRQHDMQQGAANGQEIQAYKEATGVDSYWTNSLFSGMPTFQISPTYESNSLMRWLNTLYGLGLPSPSNLLMMMMLGFFILLTALGLRWYLALIGAVAWGFSSYFVIIIGAGHIWKFITLSYIPPTIAGIILCYRGRRLLGAATAALFAMMQIDSNHIQMSYYFVFVIVGIVIAYLVMALRGKDVKGWAVSTAMLVVAAALAIGANAPSLYSTLEYSKQTMRGAHSELTKSSSGNSAAEGLDHQYITAWSYGIDETATLLIPNVKGGATIRPQHGQIQLMSLYDTPAARDLVSSRQLDAQSAMALSQFPQYFGDQPMTNGPVYVGAIIFFLFLLGCAIVKGPVKWTLLILTILSVVLAWGHNFAMLTDAMIDYFPMYNKFRTPASILVIAEFTIPILAILAIHKLVKTNDAYLTYKKPIFYTLGATLLLCFVGLVAPGIYGYFLSEQELAAYQQDMSSFPQLFSAVDSIRMSLVSSDSLRSMMYVLIGGIAVLFMAKGRIKPIVGIAIIGVVSLIDLYTVDKRYISHDSFVSAPTTSESAFPLRDVDRAILQDTTQNYRVADLNHMGEAGPSFYHKTIGGYHAAKLTRYQDILDNLSQQKLDMLNTRYIIADDTTASINPNAMGNAWLVDQVFYVDTPDMEMQAVDSLLLPHQAVADRRFESILGASHPKTEGDTIFETSYAPNRLTYHVKSAAGGVAVFSEVYFPWGWEAQIDGEDVEIGRVNYILRAAKIPAGEHSITMTFNPRSVTGTVGLAKISIWLIYIAFAVAFVSLIIRQPKSLKSIEDYEKI